MEEKRFITSHNDLITVNADLENDLESSYVIYVDAYAQNDTRNHTIGITLHRNGAHATEEVYEWVKTCVDNYVWLPNIMAAVAAGRKIRVV